MTMQEQLAPLYDRFIDRCRNSCGGANGEGTIGEDISAPFLVKVPSEYEHATRKIAIVGKETYGWANGSLAE